MIIKEEKVKISRYKLDNGFFVEVSESIKEDGFFDFYLFHEDYGIKDLMFGAECKKDDFETLILNNLEENIEYYKEEYFDGKID